MLNSEVVRLQLVQDIINLPDDKLAAVRDFVASMIAAGTVNGRRMSSGKKVKKGNKLEPLRQKSVGDPMLALIGCVSYYPPQKSIDEELYGEDPL